MIKAQISPGTVIISDCWRAYNCLSQEDYLHLTVNHTYNFEDPETGAHTNTVERMWRSIKENFPYCGRKKDHYDGYLARFFFARYPTLKERMHVFFNAAASLYVPE